MDVHVNDVEYNYNRVQELLNQAPSESPDIIVLPETWNTGFYPSTDFNQYRRYKWGPHKKPY